MLLSVIIPAWQEATMHTAVEGVARLRAALPYPVEVILVDDGSMDGTADPAAAAGMKVIRRPHWERVQPFGPACWPPTGCNAIADADWSMCPEQALLMLLPVLHGYDVAIASRELPDSQRSGEPVWRHWIGRTFSWSSRSSCPASSTPSAASRSSERRPRAPSLVAHTKTAGPDVEALAIAREYGLRIVEVPIDWHHDRLASPRAR